jgi:MFS transporter, OFA family, oxalate/formate antiporter
MSPLVQMLVRESAAGAFLICGMALSAGIFILAQCIKNPRGRIADLRGLTYLKNRYSVFLDTRFYFLWVMFFLTTGTGVTFAAHLNNLMRVQSGFEKGFIAVAVFAFCNAAGRIIGGGLSDRIGRKRSMTTIISFMALTLILVLFSRTPFLLIAAVSLVGLAYGGLYSIFPSAVVTFFGETNFGFNYGLIFTGLGAAGIFPYLGGVLLEAYGSYNAILTLLLGANLLAVIISLRLRVEGKNR